MFELTTSFVLYKILVQWSIPNIFEQPHKIHLHSSCSCPFPTRWGRNTISSPSAPLYQPTCQHSLLSYACHHPYKSSYAVPFLHITYLPFFNTCIHHVCIHPYLPLLIFSVAGVNFSPHHITFPTMALPVTKPNSKLDTKHWETGSAWPHAWHNQEPTPQPVMRQ